MKRSYLIQRLNPPHELRLGNLKFKDNPFSFGGGLRNGGLSEEAMAMIRGVFSFDYMGAAEYEFGAVPKALHCIAKNAKKYVGFSLPIERTEAKAGYRENGKVEPGEVPVYVLCNREDAVEVRRRILFWAVDEYNGDMSVRDALFLSHAIRGVSEFNTTCGWLELQNSFMFFTDEKMWRGSAELFGIEV